MNKNNQFKQKLFNLLLEALCISILILFGLFLADMQSPNEKTYSSQTTTTNVSEN